MTDQQPELPCVHCGYPKAEHVRVVPDVPMVELQTAIVVLICPGNVYATEVPFHSIGDGLDADFHQK